MGHRWRMTVRMMLVAMVAGGVMYCSERINDPLGPAVKPGGSTKAKLQVVNNSTDTIEYLFQRLNGATTWGTDFLSVTYVYPGGSYTDTTLPAGLYDLRVRSIRSVKYADTLGIRLSAATMSTWRITSLIDPAAATSITITNNSSFTIDSLYFFSSDSSTWGPERLGATNLASYSSFTISSLQAGSWDLKAVPLGTTGRRFQKGPIILTSGTNSFTLTDTNFNTGILKVYNGTNFTFYRIYRRLSSSSAWGANRIVGGDSLEYDWTQSFSYVPVGTYDLRAENASGTQYVETTGVSILFGDTTYWRPSTTTAAAKPTLKLVNKTPETLYYLYARTYGTTPWGSERLGVSSLSPNDSISLRIIPQGRYDLHVKGSGLRCADTTNILLDSLNPFVWRVAALKDSGGVVVTPTPTGLAYTRSSYIANASQGVLYTKSVQWIDTTHDCDINTQLYTVYDTLYQRMNDTLLYVVSGNQLTLEYMTDDAWGDPYAAIRYDMVMTRQGTGTGLTGLWQVANFTQTRSAGNLTVSEQQSSDTATAVMRNMMLQTQWQVLITADTIRHYYSPSGLPVAYARTAGAYLLAWDGYKVTVTYPSATSLSVYGVLTGETATLQYQMVSTRMFDWSIRYSSSNTVNLPQTYYNNPSFCPNDMPVWYDAFLTNNTVLAKRAVGQSKRVGGVAGVLLR